MMLSCADCGGGGSGGGGDGCGGMHSLLEHFGMAAACLGSSYLSAGTD